MPRLENWSMVQEFNPYLPPEAQSAHLQGDVYNHNHHKDGKRVITSSLIEFDIVKAVAKTRSGSNYSLGKPDVEWIQWLEETNQIKFINDLKKLISKVLN